MPKYTKLSRDSDDENKEVSKDVTKEVLNIFPIEGNFFTLKAKDVEVVFGNAGMNAVKSALVNGSTISNKVKATLSLYSKQDGKVIDTKRRVFMTIPSFTKKGSFVIEGNSYVIPLQQRLRPGAYTLKKRNGEIETMFNLSKGRNFNIKLKGENFVVKVGSAHVSLYSLLSFLGVSDSKIEKAWGKDMLEANKKSFRTSDAEKFMELFSYGNYKNGGGNAISDAKNALESSTVSEDVVKETLGIKTPNVNGDMLLAASVKLSKVFKGTEEPDDRENMMFKQIVTPEKMLSEAFHKNSREILSKIKFKLSNPNTSSVDDVVGGGGVLFGRSIKNFVVSSSSSIMPEEYNPMMMHMANHLITPLGEGGVGDTRALNLDTKAVHSSHLGFIDPIVSPEGASIGITLAVTGNAYVDENGTPAVGVLNARTGKKEIVPLHKLWSSKVAYPTSKERLKKDGLYVREGDKEFKAKKKSDVDYIIESPNDMHAPSTNLLALINSMDANRSNMGQKHMQQALSLVHRETPNVSVDSGDGEDYTAKVARDSNNIPYTKYGGIVKSIKNGIITVEKDGKDEKVDYVKNMPLARKTFIDHKPIVKVGDKVKPNQALADSNFTVGGKMALGKNVRTAWLSMDGNRNDGIVISDRASEMFTSEHMYKERVTVDPTDVADLNRFKQLFPQEVSKWGASNYDSKGFIKKGSIIKKNQPLSFLLKKSDARQIKTRMEKVMFSPYKARIVTWHHEDDGLIVEAVVKGNEARFNVRVNSPMRVGDKMSGRYGNKGVITRVLPLKDMPVSAKDGKPVDVTMTSAGVISRTNGGSLIEAGLGKISDKTGKKYVLKHYEKPDNYEFMENEGKKNKVELKETLINPITGKPFPDKVFVGKPFMMKLFKDGESGMSAVGVGATDTNEQPTKGGSESASSFSNMEANALLAYGAKSLLSEAKHVKGQKNDDFFDSFRRGLPTPPPSENFSNAKFRAYLEQMGVNIRKDNQTSEYSLKPISDKEVVAKSSGRIRNADTIYAKNGKPVKGGLFDDHIFGGTNGNRTSYIDLGTKIINPLYKDHISRMLGITNAELLNRVEKHGIEPIMKEISKINPKKEILKLKSETEKSKNPQVANRNIKSIKALEKIVNEKKKISDVAFISKVPVISPRFRPATKDSNGDISINDLNLHYQDIFSLADAVKNSKGLKKDTLNALKSDLYKSVGAMYGVEESPNKKIRDKKVKGVLDILGGDTPKQSYAQQNMLRVKQFMSGRGVIVPARKDIDIDHIEIPEKMGLKMYEPHISRRLSRSGYSPVEAKELIENKDEKALKALHEIGKDVPVTYNRAPTLWKHGILGGYPIFTKGSVIGVNPLTESSLGSDYDGDQIAVHVPIGRAAIEDVRNKMMPSQNLFSDRLSHKAPSLLYLPDQDATLGIYKASIGKKGKNPIKVKSIQELKEKIRIGEINYSDYVKVG